VVPHAKRPGAKARSFEETFFVGLKPYANPKCPAGLKVSSLLDALTILPAPLPPPGGVVVLRQMVAGT
jgi:hypothetical protein